jgi:hypothetical protein
VIVAVEENMCVVTDGFGTIWAPEYTRGAIETCDVCMKKLRALIESILILAKRKGVNFEKGVMNKIIEYALTDFY